MSSNEILADLHQRLVKAEAKLERLADEHHNIEESNRLYGKAEGVALARSYVEEEMRR